MTIRYEHNRAGVQPGVRIIKTRDKIIIRTHRLPNQVGRRVRLMAGDRIRFRCGAKVHPDRELLIDGKYLYAVDPGNYRIYIGTEPVKFEVERPPLVEYDHLVGLGQYWAFADMFGIPFRKLVDLMAKAGMNYNRMIAFSASWGYGQWGPLSLDRWHEREGGLYRLDRVGDLRKFRADMWYSRQKGIVQQMDMMDWHILRNNNEHSVTAWGLSELNGDNNTLRYPTRAHYGDRWENYVEGPIKGEWRYSDTDSRHALESEYQVCLYGTWRAIARALPPGNIVCDGNELESPTCSDKILEQVGFYGGDFAYNNNHLRRDESIPGLLRREKSLYQCSHLCLHGADLGTIGMLCDRIKPILNAYPHLQVILDTDGTRPRPSNERHQWIYEAGQKYLGQKFGGFCMKTLGRSHALNLLKEWGQ